MRVPLYAIAFLALGFWIASTGTLIAAPPAAGDKGVEVDVGPGGVHVDVGLGRARKAGPIARVTDLIGLGVYNASKESLGKIENLVLDTSSGNVRYAVLAFGGVLGVGEKLVAIPWDDLKLVSTEARSAGMQKGNYYVLDVPKEMLERAPSFDKDHWPDFADQKWSTEIDNYYRTHRGAGKVMKKATEKP